MPQGLQVFDQNGVVKVDVTTRLTNYVGSFHFGDEGGFVVGNINGPWQSVFVPINGFVNDGTWAWIISDSLMAVLPQSGGLKITGRVVVGSNRSYFKPVGTLHVFRV